MMRLWIERELERRLEVAAEVEGRVWLEQDEASEVLDALAAAREARGVMPVTRHLDPLRLIFGLFLGFGTGALSALSWVLS